MVRTKFFFFTFYILLISLIAIGCTRNPTDSSIKNSETSASIKDYQRIIKSGHITILVENSSTSYFIYKGEKMGFEYEILREFAKELGLEIEVKIVANLDNLVPMLNEHEGDIISCNYTVTRERTKEINFSIPYIQTPQVLVQKMPDGWQKMNEKELKQHLIIDPIELGHKHISVWENSSYYKRLIHLQEEIGDSIYIDPVNGLTGSEELIEQVSLGIIDYTIVEENIGKVNARFYDNIDVSTAISMKQNIAFGIRKDGTLLKAKLDKWLENFLKSSKYRYIYRKYFEIGVPGMDPNNSFSSIGRGQISPYDHYFKAAGKKHDVDWQLLAAIAYQESRFNPTIEGFGGAYSMMQFMPNTGPKYGVYPNSTPEVQINGGMKKLAADFKYYNDIPDKEQQIKFILGTYNAGRGHISDAIRLAEKYGLNPKVWDNNVEKMVINLSKQEYYRDEIVKSGVMRGEYTSNYVKKVYKRYKDWKASFK
ncbi:MAG: transporter substrate-binding domain-containing protein [Crocinitomicaceae bacterium]|nr:transporter substrate-binding domain-containing protein [Crocinitomicaceae bacterium]